MSSFAIHPANQNSNVASDNNGARFADATVDALLAPGEEFPGEEVLQVFRSTRVIIPPLSVMLSLLIVASVLASGLYVLAFYWK